MTKKLKRLDTPEGRCYVYTYDENKTYEEGGFVLLPSVTTVLSLFASEKLKSLEATMGKEALEKLGQKAARRGTCMHAFLENYFICRKNGGQDEKCLMYSQKKSPVDLREDGLAEDSITGGRDLFYNYLYEGYLDRVKKVEFTERFTWSLKHKFAGTADFAYRDENGNIIIADFKSANGIKDEETLTKYQLQLAAYTISCQEIYNMEIHHAEVWVSHPMGIQEVILDGPLMEQRKKEFIKLSEEYHKNWNPQEIAEKYYTVT